MVVRDKKSTAEVSKLFRSYHNQVQEGEFGKNNRPTRQAAPESRGPVERAENTAYTRFLQKYHNMVEEKDFESLNAIDLLFYFREKANESHQMYVINSFKKEAAILKLLSKKYSNVVVCLMIEFLFLSGQTYITNPSPYVMSSGWANQIYHDAMLWKDDKYNPVKPVSHRKAATREWEHGETAYSAVGDWGN
jgi:hypothetical protein